MHSYMQQRIIKNKIKIHWINFHALIHESKHQKCSCIHTCILIKRLIKIHWNQFLHRQMTLSVQVLRRDTVIISVQDPVLMILSLTYGYEVNLRFAMMICDPLDTRSGLTFSFLAVMIRDPLDIRSNLTFGFSAIMICDPLDTRSGLTFSFSVVMIRDFLDTRSGLTLYFSAVMIRNPLVLKRSRLWHHFFVSF